MVYHILHIVTALVAWVLLSVSALGSTSYDGLAKTPQMGWGEYLKSPVHIPCADS